MRKASPTEVNDRPRGTASPAPWLVALPAFIVLATAVVLMLYRVSPFVNFFYISAWYPTIFILDAAVAARSGRYYMLSRPRFAISLLAWSAVLWFFFELINFRVTNWYYVFLPPDRWLRWLGTTVSFATVLPAIFLAERWLAVGNAFEGIRWPTFNVSRRTLQVVFLTGVVFALLSLAWPRYFFPMIWGALTLLLESLNYRSDPKRSLLADLAAGRPGRMLRYLAGGLAIGFIWEMYNIESRSKWIYTVPGFENIKLFEMPPLGFLGFPIFALSAWSLYHLLCAWKVAAPQFRTPSFAPLRLLGGIVIAVTFSYLTLQAMESRTISSKVPQLLDLPEANEQLAGRLRGAGLLTIFDLIPHEPTEIAARAGISDSTATALLQSARLAALRGIGTSHLAELHARGIYTVCDLAAADPEQLWLDIHARFQGPRPTRAEVRVWRRAAAGAC